MNLFQKIGNTIEENKKREKKRLDRYWKLSSNERVEYDNKLKDINKKSELNFNITKTVMFWTLLGIAFISLALFSVGVSSLKFIELLREFGKVFFRIIYVSILLDMIIDVITVSTFKKEKEELNKRFKL